MLLLMQAPLLLLLLSTLVSLSMACGSECITCNSYGVTCDLCDVGYILNAGYCQTCSSGTVPNSAQSACVGCPAGFWSEPLSTSCIRCGSACQQCASYDQCAVCKEGYSLQKDVSAGPYTSYTCTLKPQTSEEAATQSTAAGLTATSSVAKAISAGSSSAMGFGVVAKVIRNARYFSINYSNKTQGIFAAEGSSSFEINAPESFEEQTGSKKLHGNFVRYDVEPNFLINYWSNLIPILILTGFFVILKLLKKYLGKSNKRKILMNKVVMLFQIAAGNYLVNSLYGSFDEIVLYFILEAQTCTFGSLFSLISFGCAVLFLIIGIGFFGFHFSILKKYQAAKHQGNDKENNDEKRLENFKAKHAYVKVLFQDFKDDTLAQQSFLASFMIRASLLNVILCLFVNYPLVEAFLYLGVNFIFALFLIIKRPYEELKGAAAQYFCEAIIQITFTCVLILAMMDHSGAQAGNFRDLLEKIIIYLGIALNVGGTFFQIFDILGTLHGVWKGFLAWRRRLKVARAPVGAVSKAMGNPDLTFMKVKKRNTGLASLKVSPRPMRKKDEEDNTGGLISISGSPTRLIPKDLDTETDRLDLPSTVSTRKPSIIVFTGESQHDLDHYNRTSIFHMPPSETRIEERSCNHEGISVIGPEEAGKEGGGQVFGDLLVFDYDKISRRTSTSKRKESSC